MHHNRYYNTHPNSPQRFGERRREMKYEKQIHHHYNRDEWESPQETNEIRHNNTGQENDNLHNQVANSALIYREAGNWRPEWRHVTYSHVTSYRGSSHFLHNRNNYIYDDEQEVHDDQFRHLEESHSLCEQIQNWLYNLIRVRQAPLGRNERRMSERFDRLATHTPTPTATEFRGESETDNVKDAAEHNRHLVDFASVRNEEMFAESEKPHNEHDTPTHYLGQLQNKYRSDASVNESSVGSNYTDDNINLLMHHGLHDEPMSSWPTPAQTSRLESPFSSSISYLSHPALLVNVAKKELSFFSLTEALKVCFLVVIVSVGSAMQVIMLNFWLRSYPTYHGNRGNYTTFAISSCIFAMFFNLTLLVYLIVYKSSLRFVWDRRGLKLLLWLGVVDTLNSCLTIYAASHVSEVLQALSTSLIPLMTVLFQKSLLHDPREYWNCTVIFSFACTIAGIFVAASYSFLHDRHNVNSDTASKGTSYKLDKDNVERHYSSESESEWSKLCWALLYCSAVLPSVLQNILQTDYMLNFTKDALFEEWYLTSKNAIQRVSACLQGKRYRVESWKNTNTSIKNNNNNSIVFFVGDRVAQINSISNVNREYGTFTHSNINKSTHNIDNSNNKNRNDGGSDDSCSDISFHLHSETEKALPRVQERAETESFVFTNPTEHAEIDVSYAVAQGDDLVVKLAMLAIETTLLALCTLLLLPIDTLPWFGGSNSLHEAWDNLYRQTHHLLVHPITLIFCLLYCLGFVFTYLGAAYLDQINVTLCALVIQLASPCTALVLLLFPFLNVTGDYTPWQWSLFAIVLMSIGALAYVLWDQKTSEQKALGEFAVKAEFVQPHVRVTVPANRPPHNFDFISKV